MKKTKRYRVRPGMFWGPNNAFGPGSVVELSEYEALPFCDKLIEVCEEEIVASGISIVATPCVRKRKKHVTGFKDGSE